MSCLHKAEKPARPGRDRAPASVRAFECGGLVRADLSGGRIAPDSPRSETIHGLVVVRFRPGQAQWI
jgi:hypothetical protein